MGEGQVQQPSWDAKKTAGNTLGHLQARADEAQALARRFVDGTVSLVDGAAQLKLISNGFDWVRLCLEAHQSDGKISPGEYEYYVATTYVGEVPAHVAYGQARLRDAVRHRARRAASWAEYSADSLPIVERYIRRGKRRLLRARQKMGRIRWSLMMAKLAFRSGDGVPPLGNGDLEFMLQTAAASLIQLGRAGEMTVFRFTADQPIGPDGDAVEPGGDPGDADDADPDDADPDDADPDDALLDDSVAALSAAVDLVAQLSGGDPFPTVKEVLPMAASLALVEVEAMIAEHRISRDAVLAKAKIYVTRAAVCVAQARLAHRAATASVARQPGGSKRPAPEERRLALRWARGYIRAAEDLSSQAKKMGFHDFQWGVFGADLSLALGELNVLPRFGVDTIALALNAVSRRIEDAEDDRH